MVVLARSDVTSHSRPLSLRSKSIGLVLLTMKARNSDRGMDGYIVLLGRMRIPPSQSSLTALNPVSRADGRYSDRL